MKKRCPVYTSFFWAHNVFAGLLSLFVLIVIAFGLFRIIPHLADITHHLLTICESEARALIRTVGTTYVF